MEPTTIDHDTTAAVIPSSASQVSPEVLEQVLIGGDLSRLTETQRLAYYRAVCQRLGRNPLGKPFEYLALNGKLRLYALRDCTDQLRRLLGPGKMFQKVPVAPSRGMHRRHPPAEKIPLPPR